MAKIFKFRKIAMHEVKFALQNIILCSLHSVSMFYILNTNYNSKRSHGVTELKDIQFCLFIFTMAVGSLFISAV